MTIQKVIGAEVTPKYSKGWGYELWIHNDADYCGKELVLYRDKKCSIHYHKIKKETFYIVTGRMLVELYDRPFEVENCDLSGTIQELLGMDLLSTKSVEMGTGDSLVIEPGTPHRFIGIADQTRFMEFSTQHFEKDSYRIWPGDSQNG